MAKSFEFQIRMAKPEDAEALLKIYAFYVENTVITFEYEVPSVQEFETRIRTTLQRYPYLVAETEKGIIGYAYAGAFHPRAAYGWAVETSIYIKEEVREKGVGSRLYGTLESILEKQNISNVNACITYPNPASIAFHEKFGYKKVAHFTKCGYKLGRWYDMIWMEKMIGEHENPPKEVIPIQRLDYKSLL